MGEEVTVPTSDGREVQVELLPYEKQFRVPEALLELEDAAARFLTPHDEDPGVTIQTLVIIEGAVGSGGKAAVFEQRVEPGALAIRRHVVIKTEVSAPRPFVAVHQAREIAMARYQGFRQDISRE